MAESWYQISSCQYSTYSKLNFPCAHYLLCGLTGERFGTHFILIIASCNDRSVAPMRYALQWFAVDCRYVSSYCVATLYFITLLLFAQTYHWVKVAFFKDISLVVYCPEAPPVITIKQFSGLNAAWIMDVSRFWGFVFLYSPMILFPSITMDNR